MKKIIEIVPCDPNWPHVFKQEAECIRQALGDNCLSIHHIGSTSVTGLAAKPIIDMIPVVADIKFVDLCNDAMAQLGYELKGEFGIPFRRFFKKDGFNIHVYRMGNPEIERLVKFRDWLTKHPHDREKYQKLKIKLAEKHAYDIFSYCMGKEKFVSKIDKLSGFSGFRITIALTDTEWAAAKHFRNKCFFDPNKIEDPYTWTFNHEEHVHLVLYHGTKIVGYTHIQFWPENRAALRIIVIDEKDQRKGYGKEFMTLIEKWLQIKGYKSIHTESSPAALKFYQAIGYIEMPFNDPDGYESDPSDIPMGKLL